MKHLIDMELYALLCVGFDKDSPRDEQEEHLEVCESCQERLSEMKEFFDDIEKQYRSKK